VRTGTSPFARLESVLLAKIKEHRKKSRRVSNTFIRVNALQIFEELKRDERSGYHNKVFKASTGWQCRFIKRNKLKYAKRKSGKKMHPNDHVKKIENFLATLRFKLLSPPSEDTTVYELWGRFRPEHRFNMDQVPLPFVVNQDYTYTDHGDKTLHVKCPAEALRKRQFTMHIVMNAGRSNMKCGYIDVVAKGKGLRVTKAEKEAWDNRVKFFWQKNAWVDSIVMQGLAKRFVGYKNKKFGEDQWVIMFCDNLAAHVDSDVKTIFGDGKVLLVFFPPAMTEVIQPIDAGYGRSTRCCIGNELDRWLMDTSNLEKWEANLTASERRILVSYLVGQANSKMMSDEMDGLRIGCFERTGCLITRDIDVELIKPQGVTVSFKVPTEAPPLDLNIHEEVVGTSTTCTADSGMEQYIEQDNNDIGDDTNDNILLEGESDVNEK